MIVASLFSGIGGLELGLHRAGHEPVFFNEIDPAAAKVVEQHFPGVELIPDIRTLGRLPEKADLVTAGFPCQDLSQAGRVNGINGSKSGLVDHLFRLLKVSPADQILIENVPFMLHLHGGRAMEYIIDHLERLGYNWAYRTVDSRAFGLPQRRRRVFLLASRKYEPWRVLFTESEDPSEPGFEQGTACGFYWTEGNTGLGWAVDSIPTLKGGSSLGIPSPPAIWMPDGLIVTPDIRDAERLQGFPADWTGPAAEVVSPRHRWRLTGNAVTVDVAEWLGKLLGCLPDAPGVRVCLKDHWTSKGWPRAAFGAPNRPRKIVCVSEWPLKRTRPHLPEFLGYVPVPLSFRSTSGFTARLLKSRLHYPVEFMRDLKAHCDLMQSKTQIGRAS